MASIIKANQLQDFGGNSIITSDGAGNVTVNAQGLQNTPAFEAKLSSNQTISDNTDTKVTFDTEEFDTDSAYDNSSNYRFTPQVAGKYLVYLSLGINAAGDAQLQNIYAFIKKNGSNIKISHNNYAGNNSRFGTVNVVAAVTFNGSSDYIEANAQAADSSGSALIQAGDYSTFGAYKLIGA
jgi:hypothetical protein